MIGDLGDCRKGDSLHPDFLQLLTRIEKDDERALIGLRFRLGFGGAMLEGSGGWFVCVA